jgi:hypothetical protein
VLKHAGDQQFHGSFSFQSLRGIKILVFAVLFRLFGKLYFPLDFNDSRFNQQPLTFGRWMNKFLKIDTEEQNVKSEDRLDQEVDVKFSRTGIPQFKSQVCS